MAEADTLRIRAGSHSKIPKQYSCAQFNVARASESRVHLFDCHKFNFLLGRSFAEMAQREFEYAVVLGSHISFWVQLFLALR
jgi:hypothetical protein